MTYPLPRYWPATRAALLAALPVASHIASALPDSCYLVMTHRHVLDHMLAETILRRARLRQDMA